MKHIFTSLLFSALAVGSFAAVTYPSTGYYRVRNLSTSRTAYVSDNTGSFSTSSATADVGALELYRDTEKPFSDPSSIIYIKEVDATKHTYDIQAQNTGVYSMIGHYISIASHRTNNKAFSVWASHTAAGITAVRYLYDMLSTDGDRGVMSVTAELSTAGTYWSLTPVSATSDEFLGVQPYLSASNGKYYQPYFVSFPISFASTGMKAYFVSKIDNARGIAVISPVEGDIVPANTPILIECSSADLANNKLNVLASGGTAIVGNQLSGNYFYTPYRTRSAAAKVAFDASSMRVFGISSEGKLVLTNATTTLNLNAGAYYLRSNEAYAKVSSSAPAEMQIMSKDEYQALTGASAVKSIEISPSPASVQVFGEIQLYASVSPSDAFDTSVSWSSAKSSIATVDANTGLVKGIAVGKTTITATANDESGVKATVEVEVLPAPVAVTGIVVTPATATIDKGQTIQLSASVLPAGATDQNVTWYSCENNVAQVDGNGLVKAVGGGTVAICARSANGVEGISMITVNVPIVKASGVSIVNAPETLYLGETITLSAVVEPSDVTDTSVTWASSAHDVAIISPSGYLETKGVGTVKITATTNDGTNHSAEVEIKVTERPLIPVLSVKITGSKDTLTVGEAIRLFAEVSPAEASDASVSWKSSDKNVIDIDQNGILGAVGSGVATITATAKDGSGVSDSVQICVINPMISLTLSTYAAEIYVGNTLQLEVTVFPANADGSELSWRSGNENVATVDSTGLVTAVGVGVASIDAIAASGMFASCLVTVTVDPTGIEHISTDAKSATVYTLTGKVVKLQAGEQLPAGIYVIDGRKVSVR